MLNWCKGFSLMFHLEKPSYVELRTFALVEGEITKYYFYWTLTIYVCSNIKKIRMDFFLNKWCHTTWGKGGTNFCDTFSRVISETVILACQRGKGVQKKVRRNFECPIVKMHFKPHKNQSLNLWCWNLLLFTRKSEIKVVLVK